MRAARHWLRSAEAALPRVSASGVCMPAPSCARNVKLRPLRGRSFTCCLPITWPVEASSVCSKGGASVTSTVSVAAPGLERQYLPQRL